MKLAWMLERQSLTQYVSLRVNLSSNMNLPLILPLKSKGNRQSDICIYLYLRFPII